MGKTKARVPLGFIVSVKMGNREAPRGYLLCAQGYGGAGPTSSILLPLPQTTPFDQELSCISRWSKEWGLAPISKASYGDALTFSDAWRGMGSALCSGQDPAPSPHPESCPTSAMKIPAETGKRSFWEHRKLAGAVRTGIMAEPTHSSPLGTKSSPPQPLAKPPPDFSSFLFLFRSSCKVS